MRVSALPVLLAAALLAGAGCATTVEGNGTIAEGVVTGSPPSSTGPDPGESSDPSGSLDPSGSSDPAGTAPAPTPTTDPDLVRQRLLCVLERASIVSINSQFNKSKDRDVQIRVLRTGATTISGQLSRSGLPAGDKIRQAGQRVLDQLTKLVRAASSGGAPSTTPYNTATQRFQQACGAL
jgi:hypothetical protein